MAEIDLTDVITAVIRGRAPNATDTDPITEFVEAAAPLIARAEMRRRAAHYRALAESARSERRATTTLETPQDVVRYAEKYTEKAGNVIAQLMNRAVRADDTESIRDLHDVIGALAAVRDALELLQIKLH